MGIGNTDWIFNQCSSRVACVCGRSHTGIAGLNPAVGHGCLSVMSVACCPLEVSDHSNHSSRGVLPIVVCLSVIEESHRGLPGPIWLPCHEKKNSLSVNCTGLDRDQYRAVVDGIMNFRVSLKTGNVFW